nr:hypothetical protein [Tanacetum cinerariifolium]
KLLEDLQIIKKELIVCNHPTFFDNNENHFENSSKIAASNSNQEKEKPPQDSDIRQLIREECCIEVCEEQRQNMEHTMLELVKFVKKKSFFIFFDSKNDDDISSDDDPFKDIEYVEASLFDPEIVSVEEENDVHQEEEEIDLEDTSQIQDVDLRDVD